MDQTQSQPLRIRQLVVLVQTKQSRLLRLSLPCVGTWEQESRTEQYEMRFFRHQFERSIRELGRPGRYD